MWNKWRGLEHLGVWDVEFSLSGQGLKDGGALQHVAHLSRCRGASLPPMSFSKLFQNTT